MFRHLFLGLVCLFTATALQAGNITVDYSQVFGSHSASAESPFTAHDPWSSDLPNLQGPAAHNAVETFDQGTVSQSCYASGYGVLSSTLWFLSGEVESSNIAANNVLGDQNLRVEGLAHGIYYNQFRVNQTSTLILLAHGNGSSSGAALGRITIELDGVFVYVGPADFELVKTLGAGTHTLTIDAETNASGYKNGPIVSTAHAFCHYQFSVHTPAIANNKTLTGKVNLSNLGSSSPVGRIVRIQVQQGATIMQSTETRLDASGNYSVPSFISGNAEVFLQVDGWLRKSAGTVPFSGNTVNVPTISLQNGDIDADNVVSLFDYLVLSEYFDKDSSDPFWNIIGENRSRPCEADLDGDGVVGLFDYLILSDSFDTSGA